MYQKLVQDQSLRQKMNHSLLQMIQFLELTSIEMLDYIEEIANENPLIEDISFDREWMMVTKSHDLPIEEVNAQPQSMYDLLKQQLIPLHMSDEVRKTVLFGIDSLDEDGYLTIDEHLWKEKCSVTTMEVAEALAILQGLEPAGIGARTLSECILLQMEKIEGDKELVERLVDEKLEWIANRDIEPIMEFCHISESQAYEMIHQIQQCHPKPGQLLSKKTAQHITPEAHVYKEAGSFTISFYQWSSPKLSINKSYEKIETFDETERSYLQQKYKQFHWLQSAIRSRTSILESVIGTIVEKQHLFFEHGSFMLKPLTLKDIADSVGVHISTVSRAIRNKYIQTEYGIIPLKFFLQSGTGQVSAYTVKELIKELIHYEDEDMPMSDEKIRTKLAEEFQIQVARRTIMKYRKQLQIPSSMERKKWRNTSNA